jgi:hypothetical protein
MPYITREDGERFIIPSYRDTINAKKTSLLKKEVMLLSTNYGEYIALQKKSATQYEVAFSPDSGYLLGECIWNNFKRPFDMVYCEEIPNTTEAILVIVKSGSVYLDGSFQVDSIPEELVIFKTQQNNFSIYVHGNVPISEHPEDGKFSFEFSSVKSFEILKAPAFPTLPTVKAFQLQLMDAVLKAYGIGVLPIKQVFVGVLAAGLGYMTYDYISTHHTEIQTPFVAPVDPYQAYKDQLTSPAPSKQLHAVVDAIDLLYTIPGWQLGILDYTPGTPGKLRVSVESIGGTTAELLKWGARHRVIVDILPTGEFLDMSIGTSKRDVPTTINPMQDILSTMIDRMKLILPDLPLQITPVADKKDFVEASMTISLNGVAPLTVEVIARYIDGLPLVLTKFNIHLQDGSITGLITLKALGNKP